jgi:integrase
MLKLVRRPKSPNWVMRGTVKHIRVEESTGTSDRRIAEEIRVKRESEILHESVYGRAATATFAQATLSYLENGGNKRFLDRVLDHFGTTLLANIDQDAIEKGARKLYPTASDATRNRAFYTPVSAVLAHASRRGWCSRLILQRPKSQPGRIRWLTLDEANRLIEAAGEHLRPLVIFLLYTGARVGEALWLDWRDVDLSRGHVMFPKTKNGEARGVPLHARVVAALANLPHRKVRCSDDRMDEPMSVPGTLATRPQALASSEHSRVLWREPGSPTFIPMIAATPGQRGTTLRTAISAH